MGVSLSCRCRSRARLSPALDGVEAMNYMRHLMREARAMRLRMHYVITRGGEASKCVPAFAESLFIMWRQTLDARVVKRDFSANDQKLPKGAALGTQTRME